MTKTSEHFLIQSLYKTSPGYNKILKSKYGITIAGGQDDYAGKIFRLSHLGYYDEFDMVTMITALEMTLKECGYAFEIGAGVQAVIKSFQQ